MHWRTGLSGTRLKQHMGLRRFQCRGKEGAKAELGLGVLNYNLSRMINDIGVSRMPLAPG